MVTFYKEPIQALNYAGPVASVEEITMEIIQSQAGALYRAHWRGEIGEAFNAHRAALELAAKLNAKGIKLVGGE
jgi:hypothetical protein